MNFCNQDSKHINLDFPLILKEKMLRIKSYLSPIGHFLNIESSTKTNREIKCITQAGKVLPKPVIYYNQVILDVMSFIRTKNVLHFILSELIIQRKINFQ